MLPPSPWVKKSNFPPKHPKQDEKNSRHFLVLTSVDLPRSKLKRHIEGRQGVLTILAQTTRLEILCRNKLVVERPLQSISKSAKKTKNSRKIAWPQITAHIFWTLFEGMAQSTFPTEVSGFPMWKVGTQGYLNAGALPSFTSSTLWQQNRENICDILLRIKHGEQVLFLINNIITCTNQILHQFMKYKYTLYFENTKTSSN